ncbi:MAG: CotH kinase family protein, partial [Verrucomicrobiota bacterium]
MEAGCMDGPRFDWIVFLTLFVSCSFLGAEEIPRVTFSASDRVFSEPFLLELACEDEEAVIRYSTDGHPVTIFNSRVYTGPIEIAETRWMRAQAETVGGKSETTSAHFIRLAEDVQAFESPLPILVLENFGQGRFPSKQWNQTGAGVKQVARQRAQWFLFDRRDDGSSRLIGEPDESSRLGLRVRGAFSSSFPRKPFSVEAWDEMDQSTNIEPLGLPSESDWVLYAPNAQHDATLLYNTWLYELSRSIGGNAMRFRFTEAFVHTDGGSLTMDDHAGVYVIIEKVKRDRNRIDF